MAGVSPCLVAPAATSAIPRWPYPFASSRAVMKRVLFVVVLGCLMVPGAWGQVTGSSGCADPGPGCRAGLSLTLPNGARYEGAVSADGKPDGNGVMTWPDGARYEGEWREDVFVSGVRTSPDGARASYRPFPGRAGRRVKQ